MEQQTKTVLILGGTSDIGRATAFLFAQRGWRVLLACRDEAEGSRNAVDIAARTGAEVSVLEFDALQAPEFEAFANGLPTLPDVLVCVVGELGEQRRGELDLA